MLPVYLMITGITVAVGLKLFGSQPPAKGADVAITPDIADSAEDTAPATEGGKRDVDPVAVFNLKDPKTGKFIKRNKENGD